MRKLFLLVTSILVLGILACRLPQAGTDTPSPDCTPPPCTADEVYYCPGECPGGCGTECATPTSQPSLSEETPDPTTEPEEETPQSSEVTNTPAPVCTPPPCTADEVYYCPGDCPGGCGTECATPTSQPSEEETLEPPTIQFFTANRSTIVQGEEVTLSWQATGATEAFVQWVGSDGLLKGPTGIENPNEDTVTVAPTGDGRISLLVRNAAGEASAEIQLTIECPHDWAPALAEDPPISTGCPGEYVTTWAAWQPFQNGFMLWMEAENGIFVFYDTGQYQFYEDRFNEGDPESDPSLVPPDGLYQPIRGFGLVWRNNPEVRDGLGWATAQESGYESWTQSFSGTGMHSYSTIVEGIDGTLYLLGAFASQWQVYTP